MMWLWFIEQDAQNPGIAAKLEQPNQDAMVELFTIDATVLGGSVYRFTTTPSETPLVWGGNSYAYCPVESSGWEWNGRGALPTPMLTVSRVNPIFHNAVVSYGDLLGALVTRVRTFRMFLDDGSQPDTSMYLPFDVYRVERKSQHTNLAISWELSAYLDQEGQSVPRRQVLRDTCLHRYRKPNGAGGFDYSKATCPYSAATYFDRQGASCAAAEDSCGKRLSDCKLRFGANGELPTRAFPGVARQR